MKSPLLSVIMPVYNSGKYLRQCLDSVLNQTFSDLQVICVDDGSTDNSCDIIREYMNSDARVSLIEQQNLGAGAARNKGIRVASGEYVHFIDSDDWIETYAYEMILGKMQASGVDVCIFQKYFYDNQTGEVTPTIRAFDHNDYITDFESNPSFFIHSPVVPWNKICRRRIIMENNLKFDEIVCANDRTFYFSLIKCAKSVMVCRDILLYYRVNNSKSLIGTTRSVHYDAHFDAFDSTMSHFEDSDPDVRKSIIDVAMVDMKNFYDKAHISYKKKIYNQLYDFFQTLDVSDFDDVSPYIWGDWYTHIKNHKHGFLPMTVRTHLPDLSSVREKIIDNSWSLEVYGEQPDDMDVIISLTSYPARIGTIHQTIRTLMSQTVTANRIILWLAPEQFPNLEGDLPQPLLELKSWGLEIKFCKDLKPHKKYFYAMKENPGSVIITADDDVLYDSDVVEKLVESYRRFPHAVSAMRTHRMTFTGGDIDPYDSWGFNDDSFYRNPSMFAMGTGVGCVLYPPGSIPSAAFDESAIEQTCLFGDDLWLKLNAASEGYPAVLAAPSRRLKYTDGSQESALWLDNKMGGKNDSQLVAIDKWFREHGRGSPLETIYSYYIDSGVVLSFFVDCWNLSNPKSLSDAFSILPKWAEVICFDIRDDGLMRTLRSEYWMRGNVVLMSPLDGFRTPLFTVASCARGEHMMMLKPGEFEYGPAFFSSVHAMIKTGKDSVLNSSKVLRVLGVRSKPDVGFEPCASLLSRDSIKGHRVYHLNDYLSRASFCLFCKLQFKKHSIRNQDINVEMYSESVVRTLHPDVLSTLRCSDLDDDHRSIALSIEAGAWSGNTVSDYNPEPEHYGRRICPVCGSTINHFQPFGSRMRDEARCSVCGSFERHRSIEVTLRFIDPQKISLRILYINPIREMRPRLQERGVECYDFKKIGESYWNYDIVVLCHQLQRFDNYVDVLHTLRSRMADGGLMMVTVPLKKNEKGTYMIPEMRIDVYELMNEISSVGFETHLNWNKESFTRETRELYSIIGAESTIMCWKTSDNTNKIWPRTNLA